MTLFYSKQHICYVSPVKAGNIIARSMNLICSHR
jgi:hypothetical protein